MTDNPMYLLDVISEINLNFNLGSAVNFIASSTEKTRMEQLEDLRSAMFHLDHEISRLQVAEQKASNQKTKQSAAAPLAPIPPKS